MSGQVSQDIRLRVVQALKAYISSFNISQRELAKRLGVTPASVTLWLKGKGIRFFTAAKIFRLCDKGLGVEPPPEIPLKTGVSDAIKFALVYDMLNSGLDIKVVRKAAAFIKAYDFDSLLNRLAVESDLKNRSCKNVFTDVGREDDQHGAAIAAGVEGEQVEH